MEKVLHSTTDSNIPLQQNVVDLDDQVLRQLVNVELNRLTITLCILIIIAYVLGYFQLTVLVPFILCSYALWIWKTKIKQLQRWFYHEHEMREHRRRALDQSETCEWLNYLLNRWWYFSDRTIYDLLKQGLDPVLESCKPKFIKSIELGDFTVGKRTPFLKYLRVFDMTDDLRKLMASEVVYRNPPNDLPTRPKYQVALEADMGLDAPESKMVIKLKLDKVGDTDVVIEKFKIRGRMQLVLYFNQNINFPHLAAFSISFLHVPKVSFEIRLLKKIQLMEFPLIREWISELVNDSLKMSLVDPGHITIPLCNDPDLLGRQTGYNAGVLTLTLKGGLHGKATSDEQWCTVTLGKQKLRTKDITADVIWQEQVSLLVNSLQFDKLRVKIKGKRRFGPNYTVVEYILPLIRLNLEQNPEQQIELADENKEGSNLQLNFNYSSLPILDVSNNADEETFMKNFVKKNGDEQPEDVYWYNHEETNSEMGFQPMTLFLVSGVLFVRVHKGISLIPMDSSGTSDPYVMIFANKELVQMGHVIEETLNPEWDTMIEFFTLDYTQTTLSFIVHDRNPMVLSTVLLADDNDDFMGSCNLKLAKKDWFLFKKELNLLYKFRGDARRGKEECLKKVGKLVVSVVFRPISSIKSSIRPTVNQGMIEGEPLYQKKSKIDAVTMEAILRSERGSLTICILRARNLIALDLNGRSDPFVIVRVGDLKQEKYKTKVIYRTLNPVWNEQVTLAMPQKHQRVSIEVWDKDPFTQEKMGFVRFHHDDLLHLGEVGLNDKHWFDLEQAKSGEIQLAFQVTLVEKEKTSYRHDLLEVDEPNNELTESYSYGSDPEEYLVLNDKPVATEQRQSTDDENAKTLQRAQSVNIPFHPKDLTSNSSTFNNRDQEHGVILAAQEDVDGIVDFTGEPSKYYGIYGKVIEIIGLYTHPDIDEVYAKVKLDRHAKFQGPTRSILNRTDRILCKTPSLRVTQRIEVNEEFKIKSGIGVSPCIYLLLEVKSDKKGNDVIDSHSMLLRNFFRGENPATRIVELDNGGKMKLQLGHVVSEEKSYKKLRRGSKFQTSVLNVFDEKVFCTLLLMEKAIYSESSSDTETEEEELDEEEEDDDEEEEEEEEIDDEEIDDEEDDGEDDDGEDDDEDDEDCIADVDVGVDEEMEKDDSEVNVNIKVEMNNVTKLKSKPQFDQKQDKKTSNSIEMEDCFNSQKTSLKSFKSNSKPDIVNQTTEKSVTTLPNIKKKTPGRSSLLTGRGLTTQMLIDENILEPGESCLTINYLGRNFVGDLNRDGTIKCHNMNHIFSSPSAWAMNCKKQVNPDKKSGCGWASVKYKGRKLDEFKSRWFRKQKIEQQVAASSENDSMLSNHGASSKKDTPRSKPNVLPTQNYLTFSEALNATQGAKLNNASMKAPPKGIRKRAKTRISVKHSMVQTNSEPTTLVELSSFQSIGKIQPFSLSISTSALLVMDFHCHLTTSEVSGYVAGLWDIGRQHLRATRCYPLKTRPNTAKAKGEAAEEKIREDIETNGLTLMGWYHSHPFCQADPCLTDIQSQLEYQDALRDRNFEPCVGLIISPFDSYKKESQINAFWVRQPVSANQVGLPLAVKFTTHQDQTLTQNIIDEMVDLVNFYRSTAEVIRFSEIWSSDSSYLDKLKHSIIRKFPQDQTDGRLLDFIHKMLSAVCR